MSGRNAPGHEGGGSRVTRTLWHRRKYRFLSRRRRSTNVSAFMQLGRTEVVTSRDLDKETFLEEALVHWRDNCAAEHFQSAYDEIAPFLGSLAQIVHARKKIVKIIFSRLIHEAQLSLRALMEVLAGLVRDIQDMFLEFLPELIEIVVSLSTALAWEPEVLGFVFVALKKVVRYLRRAIRPMLKDFLTKTVRPLILHPDPFVQKLSCQCLAALLEQVTVRTRRMAIRCMLGVVCINRGKQEFMQGYAALVGQMLMGVRGTLRHRAADVMRILVDSDLIRIIHFRHHRASCDDSTHSWLDEEFLQHTSLDYVKNVIGRYLVKRLDRPSTIELWKIVLYLMRSKIDDWHHSMVEDEKLESSSLLNGTTRLIAVVSFILARKKGALLKNLNPLVRFLKMISSEAVQGELDAMEVRSWAAEWFARETATLIMHALNLEGRFRKDPLWNECQARLQTLMENLDHLSLPDVFSISKEASRDLSSLKILVRPLLCRLTALVMDGSASDVHQEMAWVQLDMFLDSISETDIAVEGKKLFGDTSFPEWLLEMMKAWPLDKCTQHFSSRNSRAAAVMATLYLKSACKIYVHEPTVVAESAKQMLSSLMAIDLSDPPASLSEEDFSSLRCRIVLSLAENEAKLSREEESRNALPRLVEHFSEALSRLKVFPSESANLHCVSELSRMIQSTRVPFSDAPFEASEMTGEEDSMDFSELVSGLDLEYWIKRLEPSLSSPDSHVRCSALEFLSMFDQSSTTDSSSSSRFCLFSKLLEIEKGDLNGLDRRAVRLVEDISTQIEHGLLYDAFHSPCFHSFLGLLHLCYKPIWPLAVRMLSFLMDMYFQEYWPRILERVELLHSSILSNRRQTEKIADGGRSCGFETIRERELSTLGKQEIADSTTDDFTVLTCLIQVIEVVNPSHLETKIFEWLPLVLKWIHHKPSKEYLAQQADTEAKLLNQGTWNKGAQLFLKSLSGINSLSSVDRRDELIQCLGELLTEKDLQKAALSVLAKFNLQFLDPYLSSLLKMTEKEGVKHALIHFHLVLDGGNIAAGDREQLMPIIVRLLFPNITTKKKKRGDAVLSYLSSAEPHELLPLIELCFRPWDHLIKQQANDRERLSGSLKFDMFDHCWWFSFLQQSSLDFWTERMEFEMTTDADRRALLRLVDILVFNMGHKLQPYLNFLMAWPISTLTFCLENEDVEDFCETQLHCVSLLASFLEQFSDSCASHDLLEVLTHASRQLTSRFANTSTSQGLSATAELLRSILDIPRFAQELSSSAEADTGMDTLTHLLLPVLALLSDPQSSQERQGMVLDIVDLCVGYEECRILHLSAAFLHGLLASIRDYISTTASGNRLNASDLNRTLSILERLLIQDHSEGILHPLAHALFAFLKTSCLDSTVLPVLKCLANLFTRASKMAGVIFAAEELWGFVSILAVNALKISARECRTKLSNVFTALSAHLPSFAFSAELFADMCSFLPNQVEEFDYDRRLDAFKTLTDSFWSLKRQEEADLLLNACLYEMQNEKDFTLRQAASAALQKVVTSCDEERAGGLNALGLKQWLFDKLIQSVASSCLAVRQEQLVVVWTIVDAAKHNAYPWKKYLFSKDVEQDFFHNVANIKVSRRIKAWRRVITHLESHLSWIRDTGERTVPSELIEMAKLLTPLLLQSISESDRNDKSKSKTNHFANRAREACLVDTCAQALSIVACLLPWPPYRKLLNQLLGLVRREQHPTKGMIRALCVVVDACYSNARVAQPLDHRNASSGPFVDSGAMHDDDIAANEEKRMSEYLSSKVLPVLDGFFVNQKEDKACLPVAVSQARILASVGRTDYTDLRGFLLKLAHRLLSREQSVRDDARKVFVAVSVAVGSQFLHQCLQALSSALPMKGYTAHVLDHTLYSVLEAVGEMSCATDVDVVMSLVLPLVDISLFGEVAEARGAHEFASKYREAKSTRSKETFYLLCKLSTFQTQGLIIKQFLEEEIVMCNILWRRMIVESLLDCAARGFFANPTAGLSEKLAFVRKIVIEELAEENEITKSIEQSDVNTIEQLEQSVHKRRKDVLDKYRHLLLEMAVNFLRMALKHTSVCSDASLQEIDMFVPLLISCLHGRRGKVASLTLKALAHMVALPLPSLKENATEAGSAVIRLLDSVPNMNDPVSQDCLRLLARILHARDWFQPTSLQVNSLLTLISVDLDVRTDPHASFKLLRSILDRKIIVPKVYDLMKQVREMMIQYQSGPIRQMASSLFLQFLLNFPLSDQQVEQHIVFILANLSYEYETGRAEALDMIHQIVQKFPDELVKDKHVLIYIPLLQRLHQESVASLKKQTAEVLKCLFAKLPDKDIRELIKMNLTWIETPSDSLRLMGFQAMFVLMENHSHLCRDREESLLNLCQKCISARTSLLSSYNAGEPLEWKGLYCALHLMELLCKGPTQLLQPPFDAEPWEDIVKLLRFPHTWIRAVSLRLIGYAFTVLESQIESLMIEDAAGLVGKMTAAQLAFACNMVLESNVVDEGAALQSTKNLVWLAPVLNIQSGCLPRKNETSVEDNIPQCENVTGPPGLSLMGLIRRMNRYANDRSKASERLRTAALKFLAALAIRLNNFQCLESYLPLMLDPIYRLVECKELRSTEEDAKNLAQEVMGHIMGITERDVFMHAYTEAKKDVEASRKKRKAKEAIQKVTNPERAAKRRLEQNRKTSATRKRKFATHEQETEVDSTTREQRIAEWGEEDVTEDELMEIEEQPVEETNGD